MMDRTGRSKRLALSHLASTVLAFVVGVVVLGVFWPGGLICDTFAPDQADISRPGPAELSYGIAAVGLFLAVAAAGVFGSLVGLRSQKGASPHRLLPSVVALFVPHVLLMVTLVLLSRISVYEGLQDLTDMSAFHVVDDCANAFRLTLFTVPLFMIPILVMFATAHRLGRGRASSAPDRL